MARRAELRRLLPPGARCPALERNGYALLTDLGDARYAVIIQALEGFQAEFLALTAGAWPPEYPIPGDALAHFSRQWEYPYTWVNAGPPGRVLDAGSGITFLPFLLSAAGFDVECCDDGGALDFPGRYRDAASRTGCDVRFTTCSLSALPHADASFDAAVCVSVLEHTGQDAPLIVSELARVVRPGGRLVLTMDVDLGRDGGPRVEDAAALLGELWAAFAPAHPVDLRRPASLLTSRSFLGGADEWRLPPPWRRPGSPHFRSIAILAVTGIRS